MSWKPGTKSEDEDSKPSDDYESVNYKYLLDELHAEQKFYRELKEREVQLFDLPHGRSAITAAQHQELNASNWEKRVSEPSLTHLVSVFLVSFFLLVTFMAPFA